MQRKEDQVVEIDGVAGAQGGLIAGLNVPRQGRGVGVVKHGGAPSAVAKAAQERQDGVRIGLGTAAGNVAEDFLDRAQLLRLAVNDEIAFVAQAFDVLAQDAHAKGVERADRRPRRLVPGGGGADAAQKLRDALLHLSRRLVGKGHRQDVGGRDALLDQSGHAKGNNAGLARAGSGQDQHRPFDGFDRLALRRVQGG